MAKKGSLKRDVAAGTRWVFVAALLAMLMVGAGHAQTVYAANITVTKTEDTNGVCDPADCSLREAIAAANPGDTIDIPAGLFTVQSSLIISMDLTLTGVGASQTVIQADASPNVANYGVFMVMGGNVSISNVTIRHGGGLVGGGVNIMGNPFSTSLTITESIVSDNSAITGGAGIANAAILNIISSDISDNHTTAPFALGGGVFNFGTLNILNSTIAGNQADFGGGIFVSFGDVAITNSTLRDNQAVDGAGIYNEFSVLNVTNSTVSGNTAVTSGGGVFNTSIGTVNLNNATIAFNIAYDGGGVFNGFGGPVITQNSIIAGNVDDAGQPDCAGPMTSLGYNLLQNASGCAILGDSATVIIGGPLLGPLQNNGGPTGTHALDPSSPAMDAGNPGGCSDHMGNRLDTDQRGQPRPTGSPGCDMGAYEAGEVSGGGPVILTLTSFKDSFIKKGWRNRNEGANLGLLVQRPSGVHSLVAFDLSEVSIVGLKRATLVLTIDDTNPPSRWTHRRHPLDVHRLTMDWAEGNGKTLNVLEGDAFKGSGPGVTWMCATNADMEDPKADCDFDWKGGAVAIAPKTASGVAITNGMTGEVSWDVTQDVIDGADFGWLAKHEDNKSKGRIWFHSREGAASTGNPNLAPRLILEYR